MHQLRPIVIDLGLAGLARLVDAALRPDLYFCKGIARRLRVPRDAQRVCLSSRTGVRTSFLALTCARGSRAVAHSTASDAVHGVFMTLPPYTKSREGEVQEPGFGMRNGSHTVRSRPVSETSESIERACPATSAQGTAGSRIPWEEGAQMADRKAGV